MRYLAMIVAAAGLLLGGAAAQAELPKKINVVIVTGSEVSAHNWKEQSACTSEILIAAGKFDVKTVEDLKLLDSAEDLAKFDVVALVGSFNGGKWELSDDGKKNLLTFVKDGKGLYVQHYASASWQKWADFTDLVGKRWVNGKSGHNARAPFDAKVSDVESPITKGLKGFHTDDELYAKLQGTGEFKTLVTGDSDFSKVTEPLVFVRDYGKGRVILNNFGHDRKAMDTPEVRTIMIRGVEWAATGKVADIIK
jgi:uncharacterized protein